MWHHHGSAFVKARILASCHAVVAWAKRCVRHSRGRGAVALARAFNLAPGEARAIALVDPDYRERLARAFQAAGGLHVAARLQHAESARRFHASRNEAARIGRVFWLQWAPDSEFEDVRAEDLIVDDDPPAPVSGDFDDTTPPAAVSHEVWLTPLFDSREVKI